MDSIFDTVWNELSVNNSSSINVDQVPKLIHLVERHLMKISGLQLPPITNDAFVMSKMNDFIDEMSHQNNFKKSTLLDREATLELINKLLIDIKVLDIRTNIAYGNFEDDNFDLYQDQLNSSFIVRENSAHALASGANASSDASIVLDYDYDYENAYDDEEEEDIDSIMDIAPVVSSSPSIYEMDPPAINHFIRDSLFEINKHHVLIKSKFLYSELLLKDVKQQSDVDLELLRELSRLNEQVLGRITGLRRDLDRLSECMGIELRQVLGSEVETRQDVALKQDKILDVEENDVEQAVKGQAELEPADLQPAELEPAKEPLVANTSHLFVFEAPTSGETREASAHPPPCMPTTSTLTSIPPTTSTSSTVIVSISICILIFSYMLSI